jgi:hypothetical protein
MTVLRTNTGLGRVQRQAVRPARRNRRTPRTPRSSIITRYEAGATIPRLRSRASRPALLIVDVHGHAVDRAQLVLCGDDRVAMHDIDAARQVDAAVLRRIVGGDGDVLDAFGHQHARHLGNRAQPAASCPPVIATAAL